MVALDRRGLPKLRQPGLFNHIAFQEWAIEAWLDLPVQGGRSSMYRRTLGNRSCRSGRALRVRYAEVMERQGYAEGEISQSWKDVEDMIVLHLRAENR